MDIAKTIEEDLRLNADVNFVEFVKPGLLVTTYDARYLIHIEEL